MLLVWHCASFFSRKRSLSLFLCDFSYSSVSDNTKSRRQHCNKSNWCYLITGPVSHYYGKNTQTHKQHTQKPNRKQRNPQTYHIIQAYLTTNNIVLPFSCQTSSNKDYRLFYLKTLEFAADDLDIMKSTINTVRTNLLKGNFVFATAVSFYRALKYEDCRVTIVQERLFHDTLAIHLQKASPYTDVFNRM